MTSYATPYIRMSAIPVDGPISYGLQFPGEVGSSPSGLFHGAPAYPPSLSFEPYSQHDASWTVEQQQHDLIHTSPTKRRSQSTYHPYHYGHETARSPTRTKFETTVVSSGYALPSPTRLRKGYLPSADATNSQPIQICHSERRAKPKERCSSEESVEILTKVAQDSSVVPQGPTNYECVPQGVFWTSPDNEYRYKDLSFRKDGFPEPGIRVGDFGEFTFRLENADQIAFSHTIETTLKLHIMWPGYGTYSFNLRTVCDDSKKRATRETIANRICVEIQNFQRKMQIVDPSVARFWRISRVPGDGGIDVNQLFITRLVHRGGCNWQVELWAPMRHRRR